MFKAALFTLLVVACSKKEEAPAAGAPASPPPKSGEAPKAPPSGEPVKAAAKNACSYITEEEGSAAFGTPMKYRSNDGESSNCILDSVDESKGQSSVDFEIKPGLGTFDYTAKKGTVVEGVGEKAVYMEPTLVAVKNGSSVKATVVKNGKMKDVLPEAKILVSKMIEKM